MNLFVVFHPFDKFVIFAQLLKYVLRFCWRLTHLQRICTGEIRKKAAQVMRFVCDESCAASP